MSRVVKTEWRPTEILIKHFESTFSDSGSTKTLFKHFETMLGLVKTTTGLRLVETSKLDERRGVGCQKWIKRITPEKFGTSVGKVGDSMLVVLGLFGQCGIAIFGRFYMKGFIPILKKSKNEIFPKNSDKPRCIFWLRYKKVGWL